MPTDLVNLLVLLAGAAIAFTAARLLGRWWKRKHRDGEDEAKRASESRQVRRARERRERR